ncbi:MAG: alpha-1,2-fucosyltransferase [Veillonellaceae bacterium]|jgi:hypothetical protein|nr:alpha-1,2-fucosyltransferase [Veillonellaceae bacterium]
MVIVQLIGGLGNQMFQYACGRALALRLNKRLYLDVSLYKFNHLRQFSLNKFNIEATLISSPGELLGLIQSNGIYALQEPHFHFYPAIYEITDSVLLWKSYWQSEQYFTDIASVIRADFTPTTISARSLQIAERMNSCQSVSVHVRHGDYTHSTIHRMLPLSYYNKAMNYLEQRFANLRWFVFSDDLPWCKQAFVGKSNLEFNEKVDPQCDYEEIWLMSQARHVITANSTFSWWGAWLNNHPRKIVITPNEWFENTDLCTKDLIPQTWIRL